MKRTGKLLLLVALLLAAARLPAADAEVKAEISSSKIGLDDTLIFTLTFRDIENPQQPDLSYLDDFKVLQTSRSSEFQFSNGASFSSTRFTYYLMPTRTGRLSLPPVTCRLQGRECRTAAFTVEVVKGSLAQPARPQAAPPSLFDDDFFSSPFAGARRQPVDAYLRAVVSKPECLKGEQILFRVLLYTRNRIEAVNMLSSASFAGFWQEWFPTPQSIAPATENVKGVIYQVYEIRKAALFPGEAGLLAIPPLQFELQLADPSSAFLSSQALRRSTAELKVRVNEPPAAARGLPVGRFAFALESPRREADVNEIVTLRLRISGSGNTKAILPPALPESDMAVVYPPKVTHETSFAEAAVNGALTAEIPVAFKHRGEAVFPPVEFRYFDPERNAVVGLRSAPLRLQVSGEKQSPAMTRTLPGSAVVQEGEDIEFLRDGPLPALARPLHRQAWFLPLLAALFAVNLLALLKITAWDRGIAASAGMRHRRILAAALRELDTARRPEDLAPVMERFLCAKLGLGLSEVSDRRVAEALAEKGLARGDIDRLLFLKGQSELARFAPGGKSALELRRDRQTLRELFRAVDRRTR